MYIEVDNVCFYKILTGPSARVKEVTILWR